MSGVKTNASGGVVAVGRPAAALSTKLVKLPDVPANQKLTVQEGEGLWDVATRYFESIKVTPNSYKVARFVEALKKDPANRVIASAERHFGELIYTHDDIKIPAGDWTASKPKVQVPATEAEIAKANAQMEFARQCEAEQFSALMKQVSGVFDFITQNPNVTLSPAQKGLVRNLVNEAEAMPGPTSVTFGDLQKQLPLLKKKAL